MRVQGAGFRVEGAGFRVQGSGFRVQSSGCRVQGSGCRVWGHVLHGRRRHGTGQRGHVRPRRLLRDLKTQRVRGRARVAPLPECLVWVGRWLIDVQRIIHG